MIVTVEEEEEEVVMEDESTDDLLKKVINIWMNQPTDELTHPLKKRRGRIKTFPFGQR